MKRKIFIVVIIGLTLVIIGASIVMFLHLNKQPNIQKFDIAKYQWEIENFSIKKNVGQVNNVNIAIAKAKELWIEKYSTVNGSPYDPIKERKIEVFFDKSNDCWLIKTTLPSNTKGSVPHAIIRKDGLVIAVWIG